MREDRSVQLVVAAGRLIAGCLLLLIVGGCQKRPTTVSGTVTLDGRPLTVSSDARGTVIFQPDGGQGTMATGLLDSSGHFNLAVGSSFEVVPGSYQVSISVARLLPQLENAEQGAELITPSKYASARESGLQAAVAPGENQFSFDLKSDADEGISTAPGMPQSSGTPPANNPSNSN